MPPTKSKRQTRTPPETPDSTNRKRGADDTGNSGTPTKVPRTSRSSRLIRRDSGRLLDRRGSIEKEYHKSGATTPMNESGATSPSANEETIEDYSGRPGQQDYARAHTFREHEVRYDYATHCPLLQAEDNGNFHRIRLIELHHGSPLAPLACSMELLELSSSMRGNEAQVLPPEKEYEALSYVWGPSPKDEELETLRIQIDQRRSAFLKIFPNLATVLKQLRSPHTNRRFWVDAICIDQSSDVEKNNQVPMMNKIYSSAKGVCIWLGEPIRTNNNSTAIGVGLVEKIRKLRKYNTFVEEMTSCKEWESFLDLMKRPWFSRRWVVQEVAMAKRAKLYCGELELDWDEFAEAISLFQKVEPRVKKLFQRSVEHGNPQDFFGEISAYSASRLIVHINEFIQKDDEGMVHRRNMSLESLVSTLTSFHASNPHDIIYAVLALAKDIPGSEVLKRIREEIAIDEEFEQRLQEELDSREQRPKVAAHTVLQSLRKLRVRKYPVDYNQSFDKVARDFLDFATRKSGSLDMILRPWVDKELVDDEMLERLPSWIRTLLQLPHDADREGFYRRVNPDPLVGLPERHVYSASKQYPGTWEFGKDPNCWTLKASGFILDEVAKVSDDAALSSVIPHDWCSFGRWNDLQERPPQEFWRTLVANRSTTGAKCPLWFEAACRVVFEQKPKFGDLDTRELKGTIRSEIVEEWIARLQAVIWGRRMIRTKKLDRLGLAPHKPKAVRQGDKVCILYGCSVPVILREYVNDDKSTFYELIGECYVDGMMDGDALEEKTQMGLQTASFEIR